MINISDKEEMKRMYHAFYPVGSGPLGTMRVICQLIEAIASRDGWSSELADIKQKYISKYGERYSF